MLSPLIRRRQNGTTPRSKERGVTMALVALALATIIAMAALSIDIGTLYQSKAEAQRAADAGALTAARLISISGLTGDPTNGNADGTWATTCGGATPYASQAAIKLAQATQNFVDAAPASTVTVTYGAGNAGGAAADCSTLGAAFGINPTVTVTVKRTNLPIFFAHVFSLFNSTYSGISVSATATAEAYNSSASGSGGGSMIPVQPRCVKPWIVPNRDPGNPSNPLFLNPFLVATGNGSIGNPGIYPNGVIGESFNINAACNAGGTPNVCTIPALPWYSAGVLRYVPALISATPARAVVSGCSTAGYQASIAGCDQNTVYACGTANATNYDLTENPVYPAASTGDTATAAACLANYPAGPDTLVPGSYPFKIEAGFNNPLVQQGVVNTSDVITTSNSIVTIPIFDNPSATSTPLPAQITIVGFLQVFINSVDTTTTGNINVTVMNVSGCSNSATSTPVSGTSPVPVRLITPP